MQETIKRVEVVALKQPSIGMVVQSDIYRLNACPDVKYGVFAWMHGQDSISLDSVTYGFKLFYVDRLKADLSNQIEVQSVGIQTIDNILRSIDEDGLSVLPYTFRTFNERFMDDCAGVMCEVSISVPNDLVCAYDFTGNN